MTPTIGFLSSGLEPDDTYTRKLWQFLYRLAENAQCNLLMIDGSKVDRQARLESSRAAVFRLAASGLVDGAVMSPTVINRSTDAEKALMSPHFDVLPLVSLTIKLGNHPWIGMDSNAGLRAVLRHLISEHGCRSIVHIRGPEHSSEAAEREAIWREELRAAGITIQPEWLFPGDFGPTSQQNLAQPLLSTLGRHFDAVLACNDRTALRLMEDFRALGIRVPEDVVVCGFDNIHAGQFSHPTLTTVGQNLGTQALEAWKTLQALLQGRRVPHVAVESVAVIRGSCSCGVPEETGTLSEVVAHYENRMAEFEGSIYHLSNFLRALNRVSSVRDLAGVIGDWLPRLGFGSFAVFETANSLGEPRIAKSSDLEGEILPTAPDWFRLLTAWPPTGLTPEALIYGPEFSLSGWLEPMTPSAHGIFPLVVGRDWYGLLVLELSERAGLLELTIQEQLSAVLERLESERLHVEKAAKIRAHVLHQAEGNRSLRRFVGRVAHEINTPLAAILSSGATLDKRFAATLSSQKDALSRFGLVTPSPGAEHTSATSRNRRHQLAEWLVALSVSEPEDLAENLEAVGFSGDQDALKALVGLPGFLEAALDLAADSDARMAGQIISSAAAKIGEFVHALGSLAQDEGRGRPGSEQAASLEKLLFTEDEP